MALRLSLVDASEPPRGGTASFVAGDGRALVAIGRDPGADWVLPDPDRVVSSKHCEIRWRDGAYWLTDTSTNGTYLNTADAKVRSPHRLRDGDRLLIGPYVVAVSEGEAAPEVPAAPVADDIAPPIDPKLLRPARAAPPAYDFPDWAAELPQVGARPEPAVGANWLSAPSQAGAEPSGADWLPAPAPAPDPAPPVLDSAAPVADPAPQAEAARPPQPTPDPAPTRKLEGGFARAVEDRRPPPTPDPPPAPVAADAPVLGRLAEAAGLPQDFFAGRDPGEVADGLGRLLHLLADQVRRLLQARQSAKRLVRSTDHTTVSAFDNNPLKFMPSVEEALAVMLGPPRRSYLDAAGAFAEAFEDLAAHEMKTFAAMQRAVQLLEREVAPAAIERGIAPATGLAALVHGRKASLWDAYVARWDNRSRRHDDGPVGAFMQDFAACYDAPPKGRTDDPPPQPRS